MVISRTRYKTLKPIANNTSKCHSNHSDSPHRCSNLFARLRPYVIMYMVLWVYASLHQNGILIGRAASCRAYQYQRYAVEHLTRLARETIGYRRDRFRRAYPRVTNTQTYRRTDRPLCQNMRRNSPLPASEKRKVAVLAIRANNY